MLGFEFFALDRRPELEIQAVTLLTSQPLSGLDAQPQDSTEQRNEGSKAERNAPAPPLGEPWGERRRDCSAEIGPHIHEA
jgi:hypothetical protein